MPDLRTLGDAAWLAWQSLRAAPVRSTVLVLGAAVALFLAPFTWLAAERLEEGLLERAVQTPVLIGSSGNEFDLTMAALYFRGQVRVPLAYGETAELRRRTRGSVVPVYVRHTAAGGVPVVGTTPEYAEVRRLEIDRGRRAALLGEVTAGSAVASRLDLAPGDTVRSDLTNLYNLAGSYPVLLEVVGVLAATGGPDDEVLWTDLRTTWLLDGRLHGHDEVTAELAVDPESAAEGDHVEASAAIFLFDRITDANRAGFHLHGSEADAPVSALLVFPEDQRAHDQLLGDFALEEQRQAVRPVTVVQTVLEIVLRLRRALVAYFGLVVIATAAFFALIVVLTLRLRQREIELMRRIGSGPGVLATIVGAEIGLVLTTAAVVAAVACTVGVVLLEQTLLRS